MVRAAEKWSACMQDKGYRYEEPDEIDERPRAERFKAIVGAGVAPGTVTPPPGTSFDRAALTNLQREEVRIANADLDCEKQEIEPVERDVRPSTRSSSAHRTSDCSPGCARPPRTDGRIDAETRRWPSMAAVAAIALPLALGACGGEEIVRADETRARTAVHTDFDPANFSDSTRIDNRYPAARARDAVHIRGPLQPRAGTPATSGDLHGHRAHEGDRRRAIVVLWDRDINSGKTLEGELRLLGAGRRRERLADGRVPGGVRRGAASSRPRPTPGSRASTAPGPGS